MKAALPVTQTEISPETTPDTARDTPPVTPPVTPPLTLAAPPPGAPRRRRVALLPGVLLGVLVALAVAGALLVGRPLDAPDWLRERIEARLAAAAPGLSVDFGRMSVVVERDGLARVILWDVAVANDRGATVAELSDLEAAFAPLSLLRRQPVLREAHLSGAFVTLMRDPQGRIGLALGDAFAHGTEAPDLPQMVAALDRLFTDPRLAALDRVEADALTIRYEDQRARRGWTVDGGRLRLTRANGVLDLAGDFALLGGGDRAAAIEVNAASPIGRNVVEFGLILRDLPAHDIATQSPALAFLEVLDAPISGAVRSLMREDGSLGPLSATLQIGAGVLQPNAATRPVPFDSARTYLTYAPETGLLSFDEISVSAPEAAFSATGKTRLVGIESGWPSALTGQMRLTALRLAGVGPLTQEVSVSGADAAFKLTLEPFQLSLGRLAVTDPALPLRAWGELIARPDGWQIGLDATLAATDKAQVLSFWPETVIPQTRNFVSERVLAGAISDITFALRSEPGAPPRPYVDFAFADGALRLNDRMPDITGGAGRITIFDNRLALRLDRGGIEPGQGGRIDLAGSEFVIPDLRQRPSTGLVALRARGSVTAALAYVDNDAWQVLRRAGRDASLATGQAEVTGTIAVPLKGGLRLPDIDLALTGTLRGVASDTLVPGRPFAADRLALALSNAQVSIAGPVTLSGVPAEGRWVQPLRGGQGKVTADVRIAPETLRAFGVALPQGMLTGRGDGQLALDLTRDGAGFVLESDLGGIALSVPQIGWRLSEAQTGRFRLIGRLGQRISVESLSLAGAGLEARGTLALSAGGGFEALRLDTLKVGDWMDVAARLSGRGPGAAPGIEIAGGLIDLRRAPFGGGAGGGGAGGAGGGGAPLALAVERLQVTDSIVLEGFRGDFTTARGLEGSFTGQLGGRAPVQGRVVPQNGRSAFRVTGEDAGDILRAAGLLKTVQNGTFRLDLAPVSGQAGTYDGDLRIEGARLRNAPAIASLLDAVSVVGLLDQLNGPGIFFQEVEARFRLTPGRVILTRSSAVGPSMGISMDGFYDLGTGSMDFQGVLSPIYVLNAVGRLIARKGEGLIGFNFTLQGPVAEPRVGVNPLSVFTPGMFRDIFRRPPPKVSQ